MRTHRIAVWPGDGVGPEVIEAAWPVLVAAGERFDFTLEGHWLDWSCDHYLAHGRMMPEDAFSTLAGYPAIYLGALGWPDKVPDHIALHGSILATRKHFDLYVNRRPHRCLAGVDGPLRKSGFDIEVIRENTEGEYVGAGGRAHAGTTHEVAVEMAVFTRRAVERILRHGFERARLRRGRLASVTKSNAQRHTMVFWDEVTEALAAEYPDVDVTRYHVDAMAARFVTHPESLDVVVASNLFGDILTDIGAAIQGGLGFAASANVNPESGAPGLFEPVHGSAPDIAGKGLANPMAALWAGAMMLEHLGEKDAGEAVVAAMEAVTGRGDGTPDLAGRMSTREAAEAVREALADA